MSQENLEIVRTAYEAFGRRDTEAMLDLISDDFALDLSKHPIPDFPNVGTGPEHLTRFLATYIAGFSDYTLEATRLLEARSQVVAACHDTAHLGPALVRRDLAHVWTISEGKIARVQVFPTIGEALQAAGMRE